MDTIVLNDYLYGYNSNKLKINFPLLILKISKNNCGSCIQEQILRLQDSNISNILIFAHFETERERYFFNKEFGAMFNIIFMDNNSLIETLDDNNAPYLFIVDDDLSTRLHFIPQRGKNKLTDEYYQLVSKIVEEK